MASFPNPCPVPQAEHSRPSHIDPNSSSCLYQVRERRAAGNLWQRPPSPQLWLPSGSGPQPPKIVPFSLGTVRIKGVHEMRAVISLFYETRDIHYTRTPSLDAAVRALAHHPLWQQKPRGFLPQREYRFCLRRSCPAKRKGRKLWSQACLSLPFQLSNLHMPDSPRRGARRGCQKDRRFL